VSLAASIPGISPRDVQEAAQGGQAWRRQWKWRAQCLAEAQLETQHFEEIRFAALTLPDDAPVMTIRPCCDI